MFRNEIKAYFHLHVTICKLLREILPLALPHQNHKNCFNLQVEMQNCVMSAALDSKKVVMNL